MALQSYLSATEAAALIGIDSSHMRRLLIAGAVRGHKVGKAWLVVRSSAEAYQRSTTLGRPKST